MRESTAKEIKFESIEDLFATPREFDENTISMVPLRNLYSFANHPYRVMDDDKMMELVESIKENGVLEPAIVRLRALGGYAIISGHRRKRACELAGMDEMPVFIKNLSDDDAAIMMVDANNQREELLYSEKAWAYRIKYEALKHLIDHAWGWEPCTISDVKSYQPESNSLSSGQVLQEAYTVEKARIITMEMTDRLVLDLVDKGLVTDQIVLTIGYDRESLADPVFRKNYKGEIVKDHYSREIPKHAHGTVNLPGHTSSSRQIIDAVMELYDRIVDKDLLVRRVTIAVCHVIPEEEVERTKKPEQLDLFTDIETVEKEHQEQETVQMKEKQLQQAILHIHKKYGKNALLKGTNFLDGATMKERNLQVGGHKG